MGLFDQQRIEDPQKWRAHYEFSGALLLGVTFEMPGKLNLVLSAAKSVSHPGLAPLSSVARKAIPPDALLTTVRITCDGVRGLGWIGRPAALKELHEAIGAFGRIDRLDVTRLSIGERTLWPDAPPPFEYQDAPRDLWHVLLASQDYGLQWFSETAGLREGS